MSHLCHMLKSNWDILTSFEIYRWLRLLAFPQVKVCQEAVAAAQQLHADAAAAKMQASGAAAALERQRKELASAARQTDLLAACSAGAAPGRLGHPIDVGDRVLMIQYCITFVAFTPSSSTDAPVASNPTVRSALAEYGSI